MLVFEDAMTRRLAADDADDALWRSSLKNRSIPSYEQETLIMQRMPDNFKVKGLCGAPRLARNTRMGLVGEACTLDRVMARMTETEGSGETYAV